MSVKTPKTTADREALREFATRPHLTNSERVSEHARNKRDQFIDQAGRVLADAEKRSANRTPVRKTSSTVRYAMRKRGRRVTKMRPVASNISARGSALGASLSRIAGLPRESLR
jgi:hypothetical protein